MSTCGFVTPLGHSTAKIYAGVATGACDRVVREPSHNLDQSINHGQSERRRHAMPPSVQGTIGIGNTTPNAELVVRASGQITSRRVDADVDAL